jgi:hypothetical protein
MTVAPTAPGHPCACVRSNPIDPVSISSSSPTCIVSKPSQSLTAHRQVTSTSIHSLLPQPRPCRMPSNKRQHPKTPSPKKQSTKRTRQAPKEVHLPGGALQTSFPVIPVDGMWPWLLLLVDIRSKTLIFQLNLLSPSPLSHWNLQLRLGLGQLSVMWLSILWSIQKIMMVHMDRRVF